MEIDITDFVTYNETWAFSGSIMTHGPNASRQTWNAAKEEASRAPLLKTESELDAMRAWMKDTGAWDKAEREAMSVQELNALFIQLVSGDMRESGMDDCDIEDFDWSEYYERASDGQISGNISRCDIEGNEAFGRIFYYLGS